MTNLTRHDGHPVIRIENPRYFERLHWKLRERLPMWTVHDQTTREYPGKFVVRMWVTLPAEKATRFTIAHDTLDELRAMLPRGLTCIGRHTNDLPEIVEAWL